MKVNLILFFSLFWIVGRAQQSITLKAAEEALQKNNLLLLAEQYNISASNAAVIQARIWDQPYLSGEFNAINPQDNKFFDVGTKGQKGVAIEQLIYLGGKKKNEVAYAKSNVEIAELQLEQLLRTLKYQLAQNFYTLYYDNQKILTLEMQIAKLDTTVNVYQVQATKGNIPLKEVVRLQSLQLGLKNNRNIILQNIIEQQKNIALITGIQDRFVPDVDVSVLEKFKMPKISKELLLENALDRNPEYLSSLKNKQSQEMFLKWQKSMAIPDLTTGMSYDQRGGAFQNQVNITLGIPLPLWNKNKGNIQLAQAQLNQAQTFQEYKKSELQNSIDASWDIWQQQYNQMSSVDETIHDNLESVYAGITNNFEKRNISLIEFTDFMESYNESTIQLNEIKRLWVLASINLNFVCNLEVF